MKKKHILVVSLLTLLIPAFSRPGSHGEAGKSTAPDSGIPLKEHPRPDFQRELWQNLNGLWDFRFDPGNVGEKEKWFETTGSFNKKILVPFPWG